MCVASVNFILLSVSMCVYVMHESVCVRGVSQVCVVCVVCVVCMCECVCIVCVVCARCACVCVNVCA